TDEEVENVKKEIEARIDAGFTGFAVDTSFLFNRDEKAVQGQLNSIIQKGLILFDFIKEKIYICWHEMIDRWNYEKIQKTKQVQAILATKAD
ncbi:unnamed protein product, partial [marine sediment metagenome]